MSPTLAVLGAINVDLVASVPALPGPGVTITGGTFSRHHGGKGGNQAVAAARALRPGGRVHMLGCVGADDLGREALDALLAEGIHVEAVARSSEVATGVALIVVDERGENQIAVAPGANLRLDPASVRAELDRAPPDLVLLSLEASAAATRMAAAWCRERDVPLLLNPAPIQPWARDLLDAATYLTPNEHELHALGSLPERLVVIETLGAAGALIRRPGERDERVPAPAVEPVDSTGAGDCFNGVLAAGLVEGLDLESAVRRAVVAAARAVTVRGAREGMPTHDRIEPS